MAARTAETRDAERQMKEERPPNGRGAGTRRGRAAGKSPARATGSRRPSRGRARPEEAIEQRVSAPPGRRAEARGAGPGAPSGDGAGSDTDRRGGDNREAVAQDASGAILGANPFVGVDTSGVLGAAGSWLGRLRQRPAQVVDRAARTAIELGNIALGRSEIAPERGDRRFADPAWSEHPGFHRTMQSYLLLRSTLLRLVEEGELDRKDRLRARYLLELVTDALAPTNNFFSNPAAMKHAFDTAGVSVLRGFRNFVDDIRNNGGMPSMVDKRSFEVGRNLAVTPGAVVYRDEVIELIQYSPTTETVYKTPLVLIPPQINKFYILDLAPGRSFIEYAVSQGVPFFAISWRNPTAEHRDWNLDTYVQACLSAVEAATEITGSECCNVMGACAGGLTMALLLGHLVARGSPEISSATFAVTIMDTQAPSLVGMFASPTTIASTIRRSRKKGYLDGGEMSRIFAWLRPNDLVWNYWVNNYLMGNDPPAFDILFWNADNTRLTAALHADFLELFQANALEEPGASTALGTAIDLKKVKAPAYVLAGMTDHIVPWPSAYGAMHMLGGPRQFVLTSTGHIQSLVNPPDNPKSSYYVGGPDVPEPEGWLRGANEAKGSWWGHWANWIGERSGERVQAAARLGSDRHPPLGAAPGGYVHEK